MPQTHWHVELTRRAAGMFRDIQDRRVREQILRSLKRLEQEPEKQGKALTGELAGYRSLRTVGQRYRILYTLEAERVIVQVVAVGIRKEGDKGDIYEQAQRLLRLGVLAPE